MRLLLALAVTRGVTLFCQVFAAVAVASVQASGEGPLAHSAFPSAHILASCQLTNGGVAIAAANPGIGGAYYIVVPGSEPTKLDEFAEEPDLACYSPEEATRLNSVISESEGISGGVVPSGSGTVVCGFLSSVETGCWQIDQGGNIKRVGGWAT